MAGDPGKAFFPVYFLEAEIAAATFSEGVKAPGKSFGPGRDAPRADQGSNEGERSFDAGLEDNVAGILAHLGLDHFSEVIKSLQNIDQHHA
jgi:hypothetical protein